jgi:hypothetical protein
LTQVRIARGGTSRPLERLEPRNLPPHLIGCTLLPGDFVAIQNRLHTITVIYHPWRDLSLCNCWRFKGNRNGNHVALLKAGLLEQLKSLPRDR